MAVRASSVHLAIPRSTKDTAALRDVYFCSRFSIRICWDNFAVGSPVAGKPDDCPANLRLPSCHVLLSIGRGEFLIFLFPEYSRCKDFSGTRALRGSDMRETSRLVLRTYIENKVAFDLQPFFRFLRFLRTSRSEQECGRRSERTCVRHTIGGPELEPIGTNLGY